MDVDIKGIDLNTGESLSTSDRLKRGFKSGLIVATIHFVVMMAIALMSSGKPFKRRDIHGREELDLRRFGVIVGGSTLLIFVVTAYLVSC
jgi:hypothetical protein